MVRFKLLSTALMLAAACRAAETDERQAAHSGASTSQAAIAMPVARAAHAAVSLPDGRALLFGGCVLESCEAGPESASVDAFEPASGRFRPAGSLTARRVSPAVAALPSGKILIAGGWIGPQVTDRVEIFDPATGRSTSVRPLSVARSDIAVVTLRDGRILLAGGYDGTDAVATVEIFDPATGATAPVGSLAAARTGAGGALLADGTVILVGGGGTGVRPTATAEIYDPATARSVLVGSLAQARYKHAVVGLRDGSVLAIGGSDHRDNGGKLDSIERFRPAEGKFFPAGTMRHARYKIAGAVQLLPDGRIIIAGGAPQAEIYDPVTGRSQLAGPVFGKSLNFATASLLANGRVLVAGGYDEQGIRMNDRAWVFPATAISRAGGS